MTQKLDPFMMLGVPGLRTNDSPSSSILGTRFSIIDSQWNTEYIGGNWTSVGSPASATFESNGITFSDNQNVDLSSYIYYNKVKTALKRWKVKAKFSCTSALSTTTRGIIFGFISGTDTWGNRSIQWKLNGTTDGNLGLLSIYFQRGLSGSAISNAHLPLAQNDQILMEAVYDQQAFSVKCTNLTQKASIINTYRFDSGTTFPPPNCSNFGLNCVGGTWKLTEFTVTANELKNLDLLCIGDSITSGALATKAGRDFVSIIASRFPGYRISRYSGGCDGAFHYAQTTVLNEIVSLAPKNAMILLGINDYNNGRSTAQLESNYGTIVTALKNAGINVIHAGLLPNNSVDTRIFNNWVKVSYSSDVQFDLFSPLAALGVNVLSGGSYGINSSFSDDGLHPNDTGSLVLGDVLTFELIRNGILSPSYPLCQTI